MSAIEIYDATIGSLGRGDRVAVLEEMKLRAVALADALRAQVTVEVEPGPSDEQLRDAFLVAVTGVSEELLAVVFPLVEYCSDGEHASVAAALQYVVDRVAAADRKSHVLEITATVGIGRVVWAIGAHALASRRVDALAALGGVGTLSQYEEDPVVPIIEDPEYRYLRAFGRSASLEGSGYVEWLRRCPLVAARLRYLAASLDSVVHQVDLLFALRMQATGRTRTYSDGKDRDTVRQLSLRFRDARQRRELASFFGVECGELDGHVEQAYSQIEYNQRPMGPCPPAHRLTGRSA